MGSSREAHGASGQVLSLLTGCGWDNNSAAVANLWQLAARQWLLRLHQRSGAAAAQPAQLCPRSFCACTAVSHMRGFTQCNACNISLTLEPLHQPDSLTSGRPTWCTDCAPVLQVSGRVGSCLHLCCAVPGTWSACSRMTLLCWPSPAPCHATRCCWPATLCLC